MKARCAECGGEVRGTLDMVPGIALLTENGEYAGETEMLWDEQKTQRGPNGRPFLVCVNGHSWEASDEQYDEIGIQE